MLHVKKLQKCTRGTEVPRMFSWCNYEADCSHFRLIIFKLDVFCLCWLGRDRAEFSFTLLSDVVTLAHWTFCFHVLVDLKERQKSPIVAADRPTLNECPPLNRHHVTGTFCPQTGLIRCRFSAMFLPAARAPLKRFSLRMEWSPRWRPAGHRQDFLQEHSLRKRVTVDSSRCWGCWENILPGGASNNPHWPGGRKWRIKEV